MKHSDDVFHLFSAHSVMCLGRYKNSRSQTAVFWCFLFVLRDILTVIADRDCFAGHVSFSVKVAELVSLLVLQCIFCQLYITSTTLSASGYSRIGLFSVSTWLEKCINTQAMYWNLWGAFKLWGTQARQSQGCLWGFSISKTTLSWKDAKDAAGQVQDTENSNNRGKGDSYRDERV